MIRFASYICEMAHVYEELAAEISQVVNSPYPTQLKVRVMSKQVQLIGAKESQVFARYLVYKVQRAQHITMGPNKAVPDR